MEKTEIIVIGAGVVGLSVAFKLAEAGKRVVVLERRESFGRETSSRNSEVVHAGIYYPPDSLKGRLCVEGNELMYSICDKYRIPIANCGKLIVATNRVEDAKLPDLLQTAKYNGARGVRLVSGAEIEKIEPKVSAVSAIYCPTSGIVDSHKLMQFFEAKAIEFGADVVYNSEVVGLEANDFSHILTVQNPDGSHTKIESELLINCAGLGSDRIAELAGIDVDANNYRLNYLKGTYFRVRKKLDKYPRALIYPVPPEEGSVGIHTVPDLYGGMRLGPYDVWTDKIEYSVDPATIDIFYEGVKSYLPFIEREDISPDTAGIHPKIQKPGEPMKDFVIRREEDKALPGIINLIGIESPGLTSSPAIGRYVEKIVRGI